MTTDKYDIIQDQLIVAKFRIREAMDLIEGNKVRDLPWYQRWRYKGWSYGGGIAFHQLSKAAICLGVLHGNAPTKEEMKAAEKRLYEAGEVIY